MIGSSPSAQPSAPCYQKGIAAVEATLALPLVMILFIAVAEFGRAFYQYNQLNLATRNACRFLINNARVASIGDVAVSSALATTARRLLVYGHSTVGTPILAGLEENDVAISVNAATELITVSVSYEWTPIFGVSIPTFGGEPISLDWDMTSTISMRAL